MSIYVSKVFTATVSQSVLKAVACERCGQAYFYQLSRHGVGRGSAPYYIGQASAEARAQRRAAAELKKRLEREEEAVPCPDCGWIQPSMVQELRRRKHRWLLVLTWGGGAVAVATLLIMLAVTAGDGELDAAYLKFLGPYALLTVSAVAALHALRWMLIHRVDPNAAYPQRPSVAPGTPPALLKTIQDGKEIYTPAASETVAPIDGWVEVQLQRCVLPAVCCVCLGSADTTFSTPLSPDNHEMGIPMCRACRASMLRRWWGWALVIAIACLAGAFGLSLLPRKIDDMGRWMMFGFIGLFACIFGVAMFPRWMVAPFQVKHVDRSRGVAKFWFANPKYTEMLLNDYDSRQTLALKSQT
jgi:hypothetical protein